MWRKWLLFCSYHTLIDCYQAEYRREKKPAAKEFPLTEIFLCKILPIPYKHGNPGLENIVFQVGWLKAIKVKV